LPKSIHIILKLADYRHYWMKGLFILPVILILLFSTPGHAGFFDFISLNKGMKAYESGDYATALKEWKPLVEQGNAAAQNNLGVMYDNGFGVTQDYKAAFKWYKLAAEQGYATAQLNLGSMYYNGQGVTQDYKAAFKWFKLSAEQGDAEAQNRLGWMYENGLGVAQDYTRAYMWWNITVSKGNKIAVNDREKVQGMMTPSQIEKAQKLTRECVAKNYKGC